MQPGTGRLLTRFPPQFNAGTFKAFPCQLLRHRGCGRRLVGILDNATYHYARALHPFLAVPQEVFTL